MNKKPQYIKNFNFNGRNQDIPCLDRTAEISGNLSIKLGIIQCNSPVMYMYMKFIYLYKLYIGRYIGVLRVLRPTNFFCRRIFFSEGRLTNAYTLQSAVGPPTSASYPEHIMVVIIIIIIINNKPGVCVILEALCEIIICNDDCAPQPLTYISI